MFAVAGLRCCGSRLPVPAELLLVLHGVRVAMHAPQRPPPTPHSTFTHLLISAFLSFLQVYRLNLAEGRFLAPLQSRSPAVNACGISPAHGLLACAGEDGALECFDLRQRDSLGWLDAAAAAGARGQPLTALRFDDSGMHMAVGTGNGLVALFDLRSQVGAPLCSAQLTAWSILHASMGLRFAWWLPFTLACTFQYQLAEPSHPSVAPRSAVPHGGQRPHVRLTPKLWQYALLLLTSCAPCMQPYANCSGPWW